MSLSVTYLADHTGEEIVVAATMTTIATAITATSEVATATTAMAATGVGRTAITAATLFS
jgi:hypothetical protein